MLFRSKLVEVVLGGSLHGSRCTVVVYEEYVFVLKPRDLDLNQGFEPVWVTGKKTKRKLLKC